MKKKIKNEQGAPKGKTRRHGEARRRLLRKRRSKIKMLQTGRSQKVGVRQWETTQEQFFRKLNAKYCSKERSVPARLKSAA